MVFVVFIFDIVFLLIGFVKELDNYRYDYVNKYLMLYEIYIFV